MTDQSEETYAIRQPEKSLGDLVGDLTSEFSDLVSTHMDLAKAEIRQDVRDGTKIGAMFGVAAIAGLLALIMISAAAALALAEVIALGWAFLIVGAVWIVIAAAGSLLGKQQADAMDPGPQQTAQEIRKDKQWLKTQTN